jgi:hypothetical protein
MPVAQIFASMALGRDVLRVQVEYGGGGRCRTQAAQGLKAENAKIERMFVDLSLQNAAIKEVHRRNSNAVSQARSSPNHE